MIEYQIHCKYGQGWEHETTNKTRKEALAERKVYRENSHYPVKIVKRFVKEFHYETSCVNSTAELINALSISAKEVSYRTVLKHCEGLLDWADGFNVYSRRSDCGLTLKEDWHVTYHKGTYDGRPCYYVQHSGIEYIWTKEG